MICPLYGRQCSTIRGCLYPCGQPHEYDAQRDLKNSIADALQAIRERVAAGGQPWVPRALIGQMKEDGLR